MSLLALSRSYQSQDRRFLPALLLPALFLTFRGCAEAQPVNWGPPEPQPFFGTTNKADIALYHNWGKSPNTLALAQDGKEQLPVVIAVNAPIETKATANELAGYLKQITGAESTVQTGDGSSGIVLGKLSDFPSPNGVPASLAPARALHYYWSGYPHTVYNPQNEIALQSKANNEYVTIAVPEGMDSRAWSIGARLGQCWFSNCPNYVAATSDALMVPREIAEQDGLEIRK